MFLVHTLAQILYHLGMAWNIRWTASTHEMTAKKQQNLPEPVFPTMEQVFSNEQHGSCLAMMQFTCNFHTRFINKMKILMSSNFYENSMFV